MIAKDKNLFKIATEQPERKYQYGKDAWDIYHTNSIEVIERDIYDGDKKIFEKGDVLFCIRHMNTIGVIDVEKEEIVWYWGHGDLEYPHHASLLDNNNIMVFDNGYKTRRY